MATTTITLPQGKLGLNLEPISAVCGDLIFTDILKMSQGFGSCPVDALGPMGEFGTEVLDGLYLTEAYRLSCTGYADFITYGSGFHPYLPPGRSNYYDPATNTTVVYLKSTNIGILTIVGHNPKRLPSDTTYTGVTNLRMMRSIAADPNPATLTDASFFAPTTLWHPLYIAALSEADQSRFMQMMQITNVPDMDWEWPNRSRPGDLVQGDGVKGVCLEYTFDLGNKTRTSIAINIPDTATPDFIRKYALSCRNGTDGVLPYTNTIDGPGSYPVPPSGPVYPPLDADLGYEIEIDNEPWNSSTFASVYNRNQARVQHAPAGSPLRYGIDDNTPLGNGLVQRAQIGLTVAASLIFRSVFGDAAMGTRVKMLLGVQQNPAADLAATGVQDSSLETTNGLWNNGYGQVVSDPKPPSYYIQKVITGFYNKPNLQLANDQQTADQFYNSGLAYFDFTRSELIARMYGMKIGGYEGNVCVGGDAASANSLLINSDPRIGPMTVTHLMNGWNAGFETLNHYNTGRQSNYRLWENVREASTNPSPRLQAHRTVSGKLGYATAPQITLQNVANEAIVPALNRFGPGVLMPLPERYFPEATTIELEIQGCLNAASTGPSFSLELDAVPVAYGTLPYPARDMIQNGYARVRVAVPAGRHTLALRGIGSVQLRYATPINLTTPSPTTYINSTVDIDDFATLADGADLASEIDGRWTTGTNGPAGSTFRKVASRGGVAPPLINGGSYEVNAHRSLALTSAFPSVQATIDTAGIDRDRWIDLSGTNNSLVRFGIEAGQPYLVTLQPGGGGYSGKPPAGLPMVGGGNTGPITQRLDWVNGIAILSINGFEIARGGVPASATGAVAGFGVNAPFVADPASVIVFRDFRAIDQIVGVPAVILPDPTPIPTPIPTPTGTVTTPSVLIGSGRLRRALAIRF